MVSPCNSKCPWVLTRDTTVHAGEYVRSCTTRTKGLPASIKHMPTDSMPTLPTEVPIRHNDQSTGSRLVPSVFALVFA